jgi:hypothetical protein
MLVPGGHSSIRAIAIQSAMKAMTVGGVAAATLTQPAAAL